TRGTVRGEREPKETAQDGKRSCESWGAIEEKRLEPARRGDRAKPEVVPKRFRKGIVRAGAPAKDARRDDDAGPVAAAGLLEFLEQPRLSHARFASQTDGHSLTRARLAKERRDPLEGTIASDEGREESLAAYRVDILVRDEIDFLLDAGAAAAIVV